jgi:hypothetical protein
MATQTIETLAWHGMGAMRRATMERKFLEIALIARGHCMICHRC